MKKEWDTQAIVSLFETNRNPELATPMAAYMKHKFPFLGIKTPLRKTLLMDYLAEYHLPTYRQFKEVTLELYDLPEREYQYLAIQLLEKTKVRLNVNDLPFLRQLIETKSWWDSVDAIAPRIVGFIVLNNREAGTKIMVDWAQSENWWVNRSAILHQLKYKEQTDTAILGSIISKHADSSEFFLQKSIGWALREYAKTDPVWVYHFVASHSLKPLSSREALRNLKNKL